MTNTGFLSEAEESIYHPLVLGEIGHALSNDHHNTAPHGYREASNPA